MGEREQNIHGEQINQPEKEKTMERIVSLCKRRGFVFQNSEIYGGVRGLYDYGPLGVEMKNSLKKEWWKSMVIEHRKENVVGIDGSIISHPRVWEASGHVERFTDPIMDCKSCHTSFRADHLQQEGHKNCPNCSGELTDVKKFNLLMETSLGVIEGQKQKTYLRGEACQNIYLDYQNVLQSMNLKIPFGIVQIGKAFRNEVTPKDFLTRQREFEQWDLQYFVSPSEMSKWYDFWKGERMKWYKGFINNGDALRFREHAPDELAHYAKVAYDIEYNTPAGWKEMEGIHWRQDWDLSRHGEYSGKDFTYTDQQSGDKFIPWVVETSGGVDRTFYFLLLDAYREEVTQSGDKRTLLKLNPRIAPFKAAVFPLLANKPELVNKARDLYERLLADEVMTAWDSNGNIGKRYRRQDEIGTPSCVTIDFNTLSDDTVTVRDRDTMNQERIKAQEVTLYIRDKTKSSK